MTSEKLRFSVEEAERKNQIGLIIWANWNEWNARSPSFKLGRSSFDFITSKLKKEREAIITSHSNYVILAVPTSKLLYLDFFDEVLEMCIKHNLVGPISFFPSNELSECC